MAEDDAPFLSRWARRKQAVREDEVREKTAEPTLEHPQLSTEDAEIAQSPAPDRPLTPEEVADLPDPDTLEPGSDFKAFLREGVPEELKRRALRRLWRSNPVFGFLDGLNDYDLDYTDAATVVANLQTVFKVGKGVVLPEEEEKEREIARPDMEAASDGTVEEETADRDGSADPDADPDREAVVATDQPESPDENRVPGVEDALPVTPQADLSAPDAPEVATLGGEFPQPEKGRAAQRRWGGFAPAPSRADAASDSSGDL
ncbi:DUF3306 domain-containing protein [Algihabitans albus]|uniref:DUF3306 domain-containing protein n=1 Tax=Algihabitans albus TaxID=2164067 RepID=UPI000E5D5ABE|nr:DUF3306 domain-containing protein [Algihabitans albus]